MQHKRKTVGVTNQAEEASWTTGSGTGLPDMSGSASCSDCLAGSCIRGGGGELLTSGLDLRLGEREGLRFFSRFTGERRRGDGDLVFRLNHIKTTDEYICIY